MPAQIQIEGLDKLVRKLDDVAQLKTVAAAIKAGAVHVKGKIAKYPPATEANMPRTIAGTGQILPWYERGWGTRYPGGGGQHTSENLGKRWTIQTRDSGLTAIVGNSASYGIFVQGPKDGAKGFRQAKHMARIGWKSVDDVAKEENDRVNELVAQAVEKALAG